MAHINTTVQSDRDSRHMDLSVSPQLGSPDFARLELGQLDLQVLSVMTACITAAVPMCRHLDSESIVSFCAGVVG